MGRIHGPKAKKGKVLVALAALLLDLALFARLIGLPTIRGCLQTSLTLHRR